LEEEFWSVHRDEEHDECDDCGHGHYEAIEIYRVVHCPVDDNNEIQLKDPNAGKDRWMRWMDMLCDYKISSVENTQLNNTK